MVFLTIFKGTWICRGDLQGLSTTLKCAFMFLMKLLIYSVLVSFEICLKTYLTIKYCSPGFSMLLTSRKEAVREKNENSRSVFLSRYSANFKMAIIEQAT